MKNVRCPLAPQWGTASSTSRCSFAGKLRSGAASPPGRRIAGLDIIRLCVGNHPSVTCGDSSPPGEPIMRAGLAANHIMSSTTKPRNGQDRSLQSILLCAANPQTPSRAGVPDSAGNLPEQIQKTCDVLCPTVGDGVLDVPDGHINDCTFAGNLPPQKIARTT